MNNNSFEGYSPFYWLQNNPSALIFLSRGLYKVGEESDYLVSYYDITNKTDFERYVLETSKEISAFRDFLQDGLANGCVNITNGETNTQQYNLLKKMYGNIVYLLLESRKRDRLVPNNKANRTVIFFDEYFLSILSSREYLSDALYKEYMNFQKPDPAGLVKLYQNGYTFEAYRDNRILKQSDPAFRKSILSSSELITLMFKYIFSQDWLNTLKPFHLSNLCQKTIEHEKMSLIANITTSNIIGFGYLPCLFAKHEKNELDELVIYQYELQKQHTI